MESITGCKLRRPDISFYNTGRIDITARVARMLSLCEGDSIDVAAHYDELYLYVSHRHDSSVASFEGTCHSTKKGSCNFRAYSKRICQAIMKYSRTVDKALLPVGKPSIDDVCGTIVPVIYLNNLSVHEVKAPFIHSNYLH